MEKMRKKKTNTSYICVAILALALTNSSIALAGGKYKAMIKVFTGPAEAIDTILGVPLDRQLDELFDVEYIQAVKNSGLDSTYTNSTDFLDTLSDQFTSKGIQVFGDQPAELESAVSFLVRNRYLVEKSHKINSLETVIVSVLDSDTAATPRGRIVLDTLEKLAIENNSVLSDTLNAMSSVFRRDAILGSLGNYTQEGGPIYQLGTKLLWESGNGIRNVEEYFGHSRFVFDNIFQPLIQNRIGSAVNLYFKDFIEVSYEFSRTGDETFNKQVVDLFSEMVSKATQGDPFDNFQLTVALEAAPADAAEWASNILTTVRSHAVN